jgi:hypothetical protein
MSRVRQQLFRSFRHRSSPVCNHYHLITCSVHPSSRPRWLGVPRPPPGCSCWPTKPREIREPITPMAYTSKLLGWMAAATIYGLCSFTWPKLICIGSKQRHSYGATTNQLCWAQPTRAVVCLPPQSCAIEHLQQFPVPPYIPVKLSY